MNTDSLLIKYEISIDTGRLYFADLYIGNYPLYRSVFETDSFWIAPDYVLIPGDYVLTLIAYYKSYSGSLADLMDAEFMVSDTNWTIKIYTDTIQ